jgi:antitoxin YefM
MKTVSISDARNRLLEIADEIEKHPSTIVAVERHGKPVFTMLSTEVYEGLLETLEIVSDEKMMAQLRKSLNEAKAANGVSWTVAKKRLGLR